MRHDDVDDVEPRRGVVELDEAREGRLPGEQHRRAVGEQDRDSSTECPGIDAARAPMAHKPDHRQDGHDRHRRRRRRRPGGDDRADHDYAGETRRNQQHPRHPPT